MKKRWVGLLLAIIIVLVGVDIGVVWQRNAQADAQQRVVAANQRKVAASVSSSQQAAQKAAATVSRQAAAAASKADALAASKASAAASASEAAATAYQTLSDPEKIALVLLASDPDSGNGIDADAILAQKTPLTATAATSAVMIPEGAPASSVVYSIAPTTERNGVTFVLFNDDETLLYHSGNPMPYDIAQAQGEQNTLSNLYQSYGEVEDLKNMSALISLEAGE